MKLLVTIVDRNHGQKFVDILNSVPRFQLVTYGKGTAGSKILDFLGIGSPDKDVIMCLVQDGDVEGIFEEFRKHREFIRHGAVAFTVPIKNIGKEFYNLIKALEEGNE